MDLKYVKDLILILEKSGVQKLSIREKNGIEITLEKGMGGSTAPIITSACAPLSHVQALTPKKEAVHISKPPEIQDADERKSIEIVNCVVSPMVGTFYQAETPESKPFTNEGASVNKGDVLCIIEAMKVMNEIKSDRSGIVRKILVQNGCPVEFGQPLFEIV
ncbi:MAG: acetyl-CoA carboxylase biotin carboxyl carrier protein [Verrucomicrobia bacterium]|nr:acetyl-CoA carboxylase biotin carboxyl carrier protein [Verrucomicrobiota bacterium]